MAASDFYCDFYTSVVQIIIPPVGSDVTLMWQTISSEKLGIYSYVDGTVGRSFAMPQREWNAIFPFNFVKPVYGNLLVALACEMGIFAFSMAFSYFDTISFVVSKSQFWLNLK